MKASIWSSCFGDLTPEAAIDEFIKRGFRYMELSTEHAEMLMERGNPAEVGRALKEYADARDFKILQGHLLLKLKLRSKTEPVIEILTDWLDLFAACGIKSAVLHCNTRKEENETTEQAVADNVRILKALAEHLKGTDLCICLENLIFEQELITADGLIEIIEQVGSDNIGICLDTGHLNITDKDQQKFIRTAGGYLKAVHIADNGGASDQHLMPYGGGNIDIELIWRTLKEIGYTGLFNFEIPGETASVPLEIRGYKAEYIRKMCDYLERL